MFMGLTFIVVGAKAYDLRNITDTCNLVLKNYWTNNASSGFQFLDGHSMSREVMCLQRMKFYSFMLYNSIQPNISAFICK